MSDEPTWSHGLGGYTNHGCRCDVCRAAQRDYSREHNHRTGRHRPRDEWLASLDRPHGTTCSVDDDGQDDDEGTKGEAA